MATETQDNSGLYFIVGGLVVVVGIMAFFYFNANGPYTVSSEPTVIQKTERIIEKAPEAPQSNSLELNVDRNGASATSTQR